MLRQTSKHFLKIIKSCSRHFKACKYIRNWKSKMLTNYFQLFKKKKMKIKVNFLASVNTKKTSDISTFKYNVKISFFFFTLNFLTIFLIFNNYMEYIICLIKNCKKLEKKILKLFCNIIFITLSSFDHLK